MEGRTSRPKAEAERRPEAVARTTHRGDYVRGRLLLRRATTSTDLNVVTLEVAVRNGCSPGAQKRTLKNSTQREQHDSISVARNHSKMHFSDARAYNSRLLTTLHCSRSCSRTTSSPKQLTSNTPLLTSPASNFRLLTTFQKWVGGIMGPRSSNLCL